MLTLLTLSNTSIPQHDQLNNPQTSTMAPSTAHLLGLPRELRDMIYSHLSRDIVLEWEWKADTKFQGRLKRIDIRLHNATIAHVLRIHPQVYAEYKEADCFSKLSATVTVDLLAPVQDMRTIRVGSLTHVRNSLAHVWYATMSFDYMAYPESKRGPRHQEILEDMIDDFTYMAPNLSVFRYAIHQRLPIHQPGASLRSALTHRDFLHGDVPYPPATKDNFLPNPPASLGGLPLLQFGEGNKLYYHGQLEKDAALRCLYWVQHILSDRDVVPFHQIAKIGVYMFGVG
jgi:hypothetical protein